MEKVQRFALKMFPKNWSLDHYQLHQRSKVPPLANRQCKARLCHLFRIVNDLCDNVNPDAPVQQRKIVYSNMQANPLQLSNMQARTTQFYNSYFPKTITLWNSLPISFLSSPSINFFKAGLRVYSINIFVPALPIKLHACVSCHIILLY